METSPGAYLLRYTSRMHYRGALTEDNYSLSRNSFAIVTTRPGSNPNFFCSSFNGCEAPRQKSFSNQDCYVFRPPLKLIQTSWQEVLVGAPIDGAAAPTFVVLCHMRRDVHASHL